jgi:hypothetical protein
MVDYLEEALLDAPQFVIPAEDDQSVEINFSMRKNKDDEWKSMTVDAVVEDHINTFNWCRQRRTKIRGYVHSTCHRNLRAHRYIYYLFHRNAPRNLFVSHKNGDMSDNKISNLMLTTKSEYNRHRILGNENSESKVRGVHKEKRSEKWIAKIRCKRTTDTASICYGLGSYVILNEAAMAYNIAGRWLHGEFAAPNDTEPLTPERHQALTVSVRERLERQGWTQFD